LPAALTRDGRAETLAILSGGTREQRQLILTRLAFAHLFAWTGTSVPVNRDDARFPNDNRTVAMFTALYRAARNQQILVLTYPQRAFPVLDRKGRV
jgi:uncharacterized protein YhaN